MTLFRLNTWKTVLFRVDHTYKLFEESIPVLDTLDLNCSGVTLPEVIEKDTIRNFRASKDDPILKKARPNKRKCQVHVWRKMDKMGKPWKQNVQNKDQFSNHFRSNKLNEHTRVSCHVLKEFRDKLNMRDTTLDHLDPTKQCGLLISIVLTGYRLINQSFILFHYKERFL